MAINTPASTPNKGAVRKKRKGAEKGGALSKAIMADISSSYSETKNYREIRIS
jgi:hypothetical protein